jgi:EAL domain-containing protein (putative c-di-GMP-specific phosphodiesterase class I)/ActR/RegA family two-component response regulator
MSDLLEEFDGALLIVEDDPVQMRVLQAMAKKLGVHSLAAANVQEAVDLLDRPDIRVVLLDLQLGNEAGLDVLRALASAHCAPPVAFLSGCDERTRAAAVGIAHSHGVHVAGSLSKPARVEQLAGLLGAMPASAWRPLPKEMPRPGARDLAEALRARQIVPVFQPKVSLATGRLIGVEALARWRSPLLGNVPPDVFIPLAESSGQIRALTELVLLESLEACARWLPRFPSVTVAVNVSPLLVDTVMLELIACLLNKTGVPASSLVVEITESSVMSDFVLASDVLTRLRIAGVQLSIDDFGTGHSSLVSLLRMPFNELKLDRMFVATSAQNPDAERILGSLIALARQMGLRSVAEGVETEDVLNRLRAFGCDAGQGWLWCPAVNEKGLLDWIEKQWE